MIRKIICLKSVVSLLFTLLVCITESNAQNNSAALATADSSRFSVNRQDGWQLFNSYAARYQTDSAQFELIIQNTKTVNWKVEQFVGKIKYQGLIPKRGQTLLFNLINDSYKLRVESDGKCFLSFLSGTIPQSKLAVIPVKVFYKL